MLETDKKNKKGVNIVLISIVYFLFAMAIAASLCSCGSDASKVSAVTAPPSAAVAETANTIEGRWYGYWKNDMDEVKELLINISGIGQDRYSITVYDSTEASASSAFTINCRLVEKNTLIFDTSRTIDSGKGVIADGLFSGEFKGEENGKFSLHQVLEKAEIKLAGKWEGRRISDYGDPESIAIDVTETGNNKYRIEVMDPSAQDRIVLFSLEGSIDDSGRINISGQSDVWTGTGWGFCGKDIWSGIFEGDECGRFNLRRAKL